MNTKSGGELRYTNGTAGQLSVGSASYGLQGRDAHVAFTTAPWDGGVLLIAATAQGLCWLGVHREAAYLEAELRRDLRHAEIVRDDEKLRPLREQILAFVSGAGGPFEVALDIRATPFQLAVWRELCAIPPGTTRSYGEIARRLGRPRSGRAVGRANALNPLAVLIPCHRAVGADGQLTGYRWGLEYKRRLLDSEAAAPSSPSSRHQL